MPRSALLALHLDTTWYWTTRPYSYTDEKTLSKLGFCQYRPTAILEHTPGASDSSDVVTMQERPSRYASSRGYGRILAAGGLVAGHGSLHIPSHDHHPDPDHAYRGPCVQLFRGGGRPNEWTGSMDHGWQPRHLEAVRQQGNQPSPSSHSIIAPPEMRKCQSSRGDDVATLRAPCYCCVLRAAVLMLHAAAPRFRLRPYGRPRSVGIGSNSSGVTATTAVAQGMDVAGCMPNDQGQKSEPDASISKPPPPRTASMGTGVMKAQLAFRLSKQKAPMSDCPRRPPPRRHLVSSLLFPLLRGAETLLFVFPGAWSFGPHCLAFFQLRSRPTARATSRRPLDWVCRSRPTSLGSLAICMYHQRQPQQTLAFLLALRSDLAVARGAWLTAIDPSRPIPQGPVGIETRAHGRVGGVVMDDLGRDASKNLMPLAFGSLRQRALLEAPALVVMHDRLGLREERANLIIIYNAADFTGQPIFDFPFAFTSTLFRLLSFLRSKTEQANIFSYLPQSASILVKGSSWRLLRLLLSSLITEPLTTLTGIVRTWVPGSDLDRSRTEEHRQPITRRLFSFTTLKLDPTTSLTDISTPRWDSLGFNSQQVPRNNTLNLAIQSASLWQQARAQPVQGSPRSTATDSNGATPTSPRTPSTPTWPQSFALQQTSSTKDQDQPPLSGTRKSRCKGPRGDDCVGDQFPMSQRGPRHASRRSSRSPTGDDQVSPSSSRYGQPSARDLRQDSTRVPRSNGENRPQQMSPRVLGVPNILNPQEPQRLGPGVGGSLLPPSGLQEAESSAFTPGLNHGPMPGPYTAARPFLSGPTSSLSLPGTPVSTMTPLVGSASERNSPTTAFPFPAMNNPRRLLSPKPPRTASLSHGVPPREDTRSFSSIPNVSPAKRPYDSEGLDAPRLHQLGLHHPLGVPPAPRHSIPTSSRPSSQGMPQSPSHHRGQPPTLPPSNIQGRLTPHQMPDQPPYVGQQPNRAYSIPGPTNEGTPPWSEMIRRHEGQQAFMTLPGSDTPIPVQVDYSQASKKADEKRQRNAIASTRHRRKKKVLQEENSKQLQDLRDERRHLQNQLHALTRQRDFYRQDRNRLKEIVSQTPGIQGFAAGPQSPVSARSSFAGGSPVMGGQERETSQGYASETSSVERPAQRQRTDDYPEFSMPIYGTPTGAPPGPVVGQSPGGLPPMHGQLYGAPTRPPSAASSGGGERLPPMRSMEGPPPGPGLGAGQGQEQDPRTGQWIPAQPRIHPGWATIPRRHPEGPAR
ncbi:hypothetical protein G7046_g6729 [Stylonectria norvegica]|nr:hypothetical protein G7046_g6729 [Stylonectria norvegica]